MQQRNEFEVFYTKKYFFRMRLFGFLTKAFQRRRLSEMQQKDFRDDFKLQPLQASYNAWSMTICYTPRTFLMQYGKKNGENTWRDLSNISRFILCVTQVAMKYMYLSLRYALHFFIRDASAPLSAFCSKNKKRKCLFGKADVAKSLTVDIGDWVISIQPEEK